jgi:OmpA-OmpF porin, OOP family
MRLAVQKYVLIWFSAVGCVSMLWAQTTPSPEQMVEQLKAPRTRSLRNLTVEAVPSPSAIPAPPATPTPVTLVPQLPVISTPLPSTNTEASVQPSSAPVTHAAISQPSAAPVATALPATGHAPAGLASATEPLPSLSLLIQFDFNSARIKPESQQVLINLAAALKSADLLDSKFAVEGHTDAKGRADYNLRLSQQRADAVRDALVAQGVTPQRLRSVGKGANELANSADPGAAENRRVRIVNLD